jgi:hypothetical protein
VTDILHRVELHTEEQGTAAMRAAWPWAKEQLRHGRKLVATFTLLEDEITTAQRGYLHTVVFPEIAQFAPGQKHDWRVWKEYFRETFLGFKVVTSVNPITGKKTRLRHRVSTEDLGVRAYAEYIDRVIAFAATDLGVTISEPLPPHLRPQRRQKRAETVDAETGEILEPA